MAVHPRLCVSTRHPIGTALMICPATVPPRVSILGVNVHAQPFDDAIALLGEWACERKGRYVTACPVYTLMLAKDQPNVRAALENADMVTADGMPLVWVQRRRGFPDAQRVYGPDIMLALCAETAKRGTRHYFLGGAPGVAAALAETLQNRFPGLQVAGTLAPAVESGRIDEAVIAQICAAAPDVLWIGLGSPKQDLWMAAHRDRLPCLMIGVGAAFDFLTKRKRQAPPILRRAGLEWAFRLVQEPRRLWRRYVIYNPRFVLGLLREEVQRWNVQRKAR